jgi:uncharacterized membrane protein
MRKLHKGVNHMLDWKRIAIGLCIFVAAYYIVGLFGGNILINLIFAAFVLPITVIYMFSDDNNDVVEEEDEES